MLKTALYVDCFILLVAALFLLICSMTKAIKKKSNIVNVAYIVFTLIAIVLINIEIVDIGWSALILNPAAALVLIILVVSIIVSNLKKQGKTERVNIGIKIVAILLPILIFMAPYLYESYLYSKCDVYVEYNYQNGWVTSVDTNFVIVDHKPYEVTLNKKAFDENNSRSVRYYEMDEYVIEYSSDGTMIAEVINGSEDYMEKAVEAAEYVKSKYASADYINVYYMPENDAAMLGVGLKAGSGAELAKDFYYYDDNLVEIEVSGNLQRIVYGD